MRNVKSFRDSVVPHLMVDLSLESGTSKKIPFLKVSKYFHQLQPETVIAYYYLKTLFDELDAQADADDKIAGSKPAKALCRLLTGLELPPSAACRLNVRQLPTALEIAGC